MGGATGFGSACDRVLGVRGRGPHLRDDRAVALPMALSIMLVMAITVASVADYTFSNTRNASSSTAGQLAAGAAESGLNNALSVLYASGSPHLRSSLPDVTTPQFLSSTPRYKVSYTYTSTLADPFWTITAVGRVENVTQGSRPVTRTIKRVVQISTSAPQGSNQTVWNYVYSDAAPGTTCLTINNTAGFTTPVYAKGDLCLGQNAHLDHNPAWGVNSPPQVQVGGTIKLSNNAYLGTYGAHLNAVQVANGCTTQTNATVHSCTGADPVWADSYITTPPSLTKPVIDPATWYRAAGPGPSHGCTISTGTPPAFDNDGIQNGSLGPVNLTPATAYDCKFTDPVGNVLGQLKWDPPTGGAAYGNLTLSGAIFLDGTLNWTTNAVYHGRGTIYFGGAINFAVNNTYLCGTNSACNGTWNTNDDLLLLVAGSSAEYPSFAANLANSVKFQGAIEAVGDVNESNGDLLWGSVIAHQVYLSNGATDYYVPFGTPVPGQPGQTAPQESLVFPPNSFAG
jgi:Tfp pilus assembly protein PilX